MTVAGQSPNNLVKCFVPFRIETVFWPISFIRPTLWIAEYVETPIAGDLLPCSIPTLLSTNIIVTDMRWRKAQ